MIGWFAKFVWWTVGYLTIILPNREEGYHHVIRTWQNILWEDNTCRTICQKDEKGTSCSYMYICLLCSTSYDISSYCQHKFPGTQIPVVIELFNFTSLFMQDDKSFIIFRKSIGSFLECGSDDDFDLDDEWSLYSYNRDQWNGRSSLLLGLCSFFFCVDLLYFSGM